MEFSDNYNDDNDDIDFSGLKAIGVMVIGAIISITLVYFTFPIITNESNTLLFYQDIRGYMLYFIYWYLIFSPIYFSNYKDEI